MYQFIALVLSIRIKGKNSRTTQVVSLGRGRVEKGRVINS